MSLQIADWKSGLGIFVVPYIRAVE